jgi:hypothetical protein
VVHVGYEAAGGNSEDGLHHLNREQMRTFDAPESKMRWVYGNYFVPGRTTARIESAAISETTAWYSVADTRTRKPLAAHLFLRTKVADPAPTSTASRCTERCSLLLIAKDGLGPVDTYLSHRTMAATVTTAR